MRNFRPTRLRLLVTACLLLAGTCGSASASEWVFRRSYHTHALPPEVARQLPQYRSRSAYRPAYAQPGFAIRGGYRYNRVFLRSGNSNDTTVLREDFFRTRPLP